MQTKVNQNGLICNKKLCYVIIVVLSTRKIVAEHIMYTGKILYYGKKGLRESRNVNESNIILENSQSTLQMKYWQLIIPVVPRLS